MIIIILLFLLIVLIFNNVIRSDVTFVDKNYMHIIIHNSPFFKRMSPIDLKVRNVTNPQQYMINYYTGLSHFTPSEKQQIHELVSQMPIYVFYADSPIYLEKEWKFAKSSNENNWPHTLGDVIMLPIDFFQRPDQRRVLLHEAMHVWQRKHPNTMQTILKKQGYIRVPWPVTTCNNPDIDDWAYQKGDNLSIMAYKANPVTQADCQLTVFSGNQASPTDHPYENMAVWISENY